MFFYFVVPETDLSKKVSTPLLNHTHPTKARHTLGAEQVAHRPCAHSSLNKWGEERTAFTLYLKNLQAGFEGGKRASSHRVLLEVWVDWEWGVGRGRCVQSSGFLLGITGTKPTGVL